MSDNHSFLFEKKIYLFLFSLILLTISTLGPPNIQVLNLLYSFNVSEAVKLFNESDSFFRMPNTKIRFTLYIISTILFVIFLFLPSTLSKSFINDKFARFLIYLFLLFILVSDYIYNISAIILILYSVYYLIFYSSKSFTQKEIFFIFAYFFLYFLPFIHSLYYHTSLPEVDNYLRFLFAIPLYILIREINLNTLEFINIIFISSILIGITALYFLSTEELSRMRGYTSSATIFGNISFLFSIMSFISIKYYLNHNKNYFIPILSVILPFIAWSLTSSRGPLIALLIIFIIYLFRFFKADLRSSISKISLLLISFAFVIIAFSDIPNRLSQAYYSTYNFMIDKDNHNWRQKDSLIPRYIIWQGSMIMIKNNPVIGIGLNNFNTELHNLMKDNSIKPLKRDLKNPTAGMNHAHNQYLDIFAKTGIFGFLSLLFFLIMNIYHFRDGMRYEDDDCTYFSTIGVVVMIIYISYMFTHTILAHQQSTLFMILLLIILSGTLTSKINNK